MDSLPDYLQPDLDLVFVGFNPESARPLSDIITPDVATSSGRSCTKQRSCRKHSRMQRIIAFWNLALA